MTNIKHSFCTGEQKYAAGESSLKESLNRSFDLNECTVLLCTEGRAIVSVNFQKRTLRKGDVVFLFCDAIFVINEVSSSFSAFYISLSNDIAEESLYKMTSSTFWLFTYEHPICKTTKEQYELMHAWCRQTQWMMETCIPEYRSSLLSSHIYLLFISVDSEVRRFMPAFGDSSKRNRGWALIGEFFSLLSEHFRKERGVQFYADKLCITPDYLTKLTRKDMNQSPKEIIDQQILIEIKLFLSNTNLSVKNIAAELNFEDPSYMCRFFRRLTGYTPLNYRNRIIK